MANSAPIGLHALEYYLQRIRDFLKSDKKTLSFPYISSQLQAVLVRIVNENTEFIHADPQFNNEVKMEAAKLTATIDALTNIKLIHEFSDGQHGSNVLVYKKTEAETIKPIQPLRKPSAVQTMSVPTTTESLVTTSFKIQCLNATAKFVKDDTELVMRYPQMEPCQAEFLMNILVQGREGKTEQTDIGYGYRSMYAPLLESMKVFRLKYEYKIEYAPTVQADMKCIVFEKIPKFKKPERMEVDVPTNNQPIATTRNDTITSASSSAKSSSNVVPKPMISTKDQAKDKKQQLTVRKKTQKMVKKVGDYILNKKITENFISDALEKISDFMYDEQQGSLVFEGMDISQQYFLEHVEALCKDDMTYMLFTTQCQKYLGDIRNCVKRNMLYQTRLVKPGGKKGKLKNLIFEKLARFSTKELEKPKNDVIPKHNEIIIPQLTAPLSDDRQQQLIRFKDIKDDVIRTSGTNYIHKRLQEISNFLVDRNKETISFQRLNQGQALFIKHVLILSKFEEGYALFSTECQNLLHTIKSNAEDYKVNLKWEVDDSLGKLRLTKITIKKKLPKTKAPKFEVKQENVAIDSNIGSQSHNSISNIYSECRRMDEQDKTVANRSRSLSASLRNRIQTNTANNGSAQNEKPRCSSSHRPLSGKEKLIEGLNQPVQSDKAVKIMQNMGWKGGALGARGDGILEPIMPAIDIAKRAGLGHVPKPKPPKPNPKPKMVLQTRTASRLEPGTSALLPQGVVPLALLPPALVPMGVLPIGPFVQPAIVILNTGYVFVVLRCILEMVTTNVEVMHFVCESPTNSPRRVSNFVQHTVTAYNNRSRPGLHDRSQNEIVTRTLDELNQRDVMLSTEANNDYFIIRKLTTKSKTERPDNDTKVTESETEVETIVTCQHWYPKVPLETETKITEEPREKLLAAITKYEDVENTENPIDSEILNAQTPEELKVLAINCLQKILTDIKITKELVTKYVMKTSVKNMHKTDVLESFKVQKPPKLKILTLNYLQRILLRITKSKEIVTTTITKNREAKTSFDIPEDLMKLVFYYLQCIPTDFKIPNVVNTNTEPQKAETITRVMQELKSKRAKRPRKRNRKRTVAEKPEKPEVTLKKKSRKRKVTQKLKESALNDLTDLERYYAQGIPRDFLIPEPITNIKKSIVRNYQYRNSNRINNCSKSTTTNRNFQLTIKSSKYTYNTSLIVLEKLPANNNYTTKNHNAPATAKKENVLVPAQVQNNDTSVRKEPHIVDYIDLTKDVTRRNDTDKYGTDNIKTEEMNVRPDSIKNSCNENSLNVNTNASNSKQTDDTIAKHDIKRAEINRINQNIEKNTELVSYIIPVDCKVVTEPNSTKTKTNVCKLEIENITHLNVRIAPVLTKPNSTVTKNVTNVICKLEKENDTHVSDITVPVECNIVTKPNSTKTETNVICKLEKEFNTHLNDRIVPVECNIVTEPNSSLPKTVTNVVCKLEKENNTQPNDRIVPVVTQPNSAVIETVTNVICKLEKENNTHLNDRIVPVECNIVAEPNRSLTKTVTNVVCKLETENKTHLNDKSENNKECNVASFKSNDEDINSLFDYEDSDDCQILNDSENMIEIDSEDEDVLLASDEETEHNKVPLVNVKIETNSAMAHALETPLFSLKDACKTNDCTEVPVKIEKEELNLPKPVNQVRKRPSVDSPETEPIKKCKLLADYKKLFLLPQNYPHTQIDNVKACEIQNSILQAIDYTKDKLPLLSCQGIQNGGLIYSCQDEQSVAFMEDLIKTREDLKIVYEFDVKEKTCHKMAFRVNSFVEEPGNKILNRLELYNRGLVATKWGVIKKEQYGDFIVIYVDIDEISFNYVCNANFVLYAGNDCCKFTIVWD